MNVQAAIQFTKEEGVSQKFFSKNWAHKSWQWRLFWVKLKEGKEFYWHIDLDCIQSSNQSTNLPAETVVNEKLVILLSWETK